MPTSLGTACPRAATSDAAQAGSSSRSATAVPTVPRPKRATRGPVRCGLRLRRGLRTPGGRHVLGIMIHAPIVAQGTPARVERRRQTMPSPPTPDDTCREPMTDTMTQPTTSATRAARQRRTRLQRRPAQSGLPHVGNHLGAFSNYIAMQDGFDAIYCIVDYHALTSTHDAELIRRSTHRDGTGPAGAGAGP